MKKVCLLLAAMLLLVSLFATAQAAQANPGEEVTVTLNLNNTNAACVRVLASYDQSVFELVEYTSNSGIAGTRGIVLYDTKVLPSGAVGAVTLRVKSGAPAGTYNVSGVLAECYDIKENDGVASVTGGTVTVTGTESSAPVYRLVDCSYEDGYACGKVELVSGTPVPGETLHVRVVLFLPDNYYLAFSSLPLYADGTFEAEAPMTPEYVTMAVFGTRDGTEDGPTLYGTKVISLI